MALLRNIASSSVLVSNSSAFHKMHLVGYTLSQCDLFIQNLLIAPDPQSMLVYTAFEQLTNTLFDRGPQMLRGKVHSHGVSRSGTAAP